MDLTQRFTAPVSGARFLPIAFPALSGAALLKLLKPLKVSLSSPSNPSIAAGSSVPPIRRRL